MARGSSSKPRVEGVTYGFNGLVELMAKATPLRSGDELAGCAASSELIERGAPVDLVFQSVAGTEAANAAFGVDMALLREGLVAARSLRCGTVGDNVMYLETGQGTEQMGEVDAARPGRTDADRNCISNIHPPGGLGYAAAARVVAGLVAGARRLGPLRCRPQRHLTRRRVDRGADAHLGVNRLRAVMPNSGAEACPRAM